ncbi:MAG: hypothetical protein IJH12_03670 [Clostridia bacterium]|nr:hypothetical protein [Clostridia bacterium]
MIKFEVTGTEYEIGFKIGEKFKIYLQNKAKIYDEKIINLTIYSRVKEMENKLKNEFPKCLEEIYGRADGAEVSRDSLLLMFFPEIFKGIDGCTTILLKKSNGKFLFSHNEDDKFYNRDGVALVKYQYKDYWIVGYTPADKLIGSSFAYNSYGMVFSSNYIYDTKIDLDNISRYIMVRIVMDSQNIDEAITKLKTHKVASAFSLNILDMNSNTAVNVEKDISDIYVTKIQDRYARANHFIAKKDDLPEEPISSSFRQKKVSELTNLLDKSTAKIDDLINVLNYETDDYYQTIFKNPNKYDDKSSTVANFSIDSETGIVMIRDYLCDDRIEMKFGEFK